MKRDELAKLPRTGYLTINRVSNNVRVSSTFAPLPPAPREERQFALVEMCQSNARSAGVVASVAELRLPRKLLTMVGVRNGHIIPP
jgi:hypothetical protein